MILLDNNNIAIYNDAVSLNETGVVGVGWTNNLFNTANATLTDIETPAPFAGGLYKLVGDTYIVTDNALYVALLDTLYKSTVPTTISPRQARLALYGAGLLDSVEAAVATNKEYQIFWEYSLEIKRDDAILNAMAISLGLTERQVDDLFIAASKL